MGRAYDGGEVPIGRPDRSLRSGRSARFHEHLGERAAPPSASNSIRNTLWKVRSPSAVVVAAGPGRHDARRRRPPTARSPPPSSRGRPAFASQSATIASRPRSGSFVRVVAVLGVRRRTAPRSPRGRRCARRRRSGPASGRRRRASSRASGTVTVRLRNRSMPRTGYCQRRPCTPTRPRDDQPARPDGPGRRGASRSLHGPRPPPSAPSMPPSTAPRLIAREFLAGLPSRHVAPTASARGARRAVRRPAPGRRQGPGRRRRRAGGQRRGRPGRERRPAVLRVRHRGRPAGRGRRGLADERLGPERGAVRHRAGRGGRRGGRRRLARRPVRPARGRQRRVHDGRDDGVVHRARRRVATRCCRGRAGTSSARACSAPRRSRSSSATRRT